MATKKKAAKKATGKRKTEKTDVVPGSYTNLSKDYTERDGLKKFNAYIDTGAYSITVIAEANADVDASEVRNGVDALFESIKSTPICQ